jgi:hypothetical protein
MSLCMRMYTINTTVKMQCSLLHDTKVFYSVSTTIMMTNILPTISHFYGVNLSVGAVLEILWVGGKNKEKPVLIYQHPRFNADICDGQSVEL